jgi:alpha-L-fucosidase 2
MQWKEHHLQSASIKSFQGGKCWVRTAVPVQVKGIHVETIKDAYGYRISFQTQKNLVYDLVLVP